MAKRNRWDLRRSAAVLALVLAGCGKTSGKNDSGHVGDEPVDAGGDAFPERDGEGGESTGVGGNGVATDSGSAGPGGTSGAGGAAAGAGGAVATGGSAGNAANGGTAGTGSSTVDRIDPYATDRRQTVTDYCALLESNSCLSYPPQRETGSADRATMIELCRQDLEVQQNSIWGDVCFREWQDVLRCLTDAPWECPCSSTDCVLPSPGSRPLPFDGLCDTQQDALASCQDATSGGEAVTGTAGECQYFSSSVDGCYVQCFRDVRVFESRCDGPVGGAQACACNLNAVPLRDPAESGWLWADSCEGVAQTMADGYCDRILDCCFTWQHDGEETCTCTSDPTAGGFADCEAAAAAGGGEVVDLCPQYKVPWAEFPEQ